MNRLNSGLLIYLRNNVFFMFHLKSSSEAKIQFIKMQDPKILMCIRS